MPHRIDLGRSFLVLWLAVSCVAEISGCNRGPQTARIRGKVHFKDGTIPQGELALVTFNPTKDTTAKIRKGSTGTIDPKDGSFEMNTRAPGDGVHYGDYTVTFNIVKSMHDPKQAIAEKYTNPNETPYKITVDRNRSDLDYELEPAPTGGAEKVGGGAANVPGGPGPG